VQRALELATVHEKLGATADAIAALERGLTFDEQNRDLRERLADLYSSESEWEKLASLRTRDADFAASPDEAVMMLRAAAAIHAGKRGDSAAAAEVLDKASRLRPDDRQLLLDLCDQYSASGRGNAAVEVLEKIVASFGPKRTRELGEIHRRLADAYLAQGETQRALDELDKAYRIEPGNIDVLALLGDVALRVKDYKKAQHMYRSLVVQRLDERSPISKSMVYLRLGDIYQALGEKPKALQSYERAVQTDGSQEARDKLSALKV
jgi:tetratricopeptide (TPR) repeat protein